MPCPICRGTSAPAYRPFCSRRCADLDLARWLNGAYAVPAQEEDMPEEADYAALPEDLGEDLGGDLGRTPRRRRRED